ncbi:2,3-epoxybenzoyl-CoA dihydrolase [Reyranella sp. CPCC 100927]|uniref:2,3-epoxybenzoyl-CoA dihydrolase n=1 Tax=Reyranella sp. CPCC 100927 TaxID=2599616 RepID=UPI0011B474B8|nr:2,3-epoxybenzoyl-CoA dihydrolase [Reyranella sp. CPCC 100927]TWS96310.1 2,3-epoxybenzoyl-CoA dihydrolase [Reyranella sp. CPCC 100927]
MAGNGTEPTVDFRTAPAGYNHWKLSVDGRVATLAMDVREDATLKPGYRLKLNSYDLGVDIELYDAIQRLRFEHPEVAAVVVTSAKDRVFCSGANINMLGVSSHAHKVNFCKFTNETRNSIEDATEFSGQGYICAINGTAAGGGYELALACDQIVLADDGSSAVSLPELPLLAVLPGTGGLTRLVDKRKVRRDRADFFCTVSEGVRGKRAADWRLVDAVVPRSKLDETVQARAEALAAKAAAGAGAKGIALSPLQRTIDGDRISYPHLAIEIDREVRAAHFRIQAPDAPPPKDAAALQAQGDASWSLALCRALDDAILHLRLNEGEIGTWVFHTAGDADRVAAHDALLLDNADHWLVREITLYWKRTLKRIDVSSRSLITLVEPGSCFTGTLLELVLAADRSFMLDGTLEGSNLPEATVRLTGMNFGPLPMGNGLSRLQSRFLAEPEAADALKAEIGKDLDAATADERGLITFTPDDIDWDDEVRLAIEERASYSPDGLTGMEANLRFCGPETMETKIFARLTAWQNWIFQRPNAVGPEGALQLYGSGRKAQYDKGRV